MTLFLSHTALHCRLQLHAHDQINANEVMMSFTTPSQDSLTLTSVRTEGSCRPPESLGTSQQVLPAEAESHTAPPSLLFLSHPDIVHENLKMGSDGESDQTSGTSSDEVQSPTDVCLRNRGNRRISAEVANPRRPLSASFPTLRSHGNARESLRDGRSRSLFFFFPSSLSVFR